MEAVNVSKCAERFYSGKSLPFIPTIFLLQRYVDNLAIAELQNAGINSKMTVYSVDICIILQLLCRFVVLCLACIYKSTEDLKV